MNQRIGYARVSAADQKPGPAARRTMLSSGIVFIYEERASGKTAARQELDHCLKALPTGDTLVVWWLDQLGLSCLT